MGRFFNGKQGFPFTFGLLLLCLHASCSSGDTASSGAEADEPVATTTEALTLPPINANADTSAALVI